MLNLVEVAAVEQLPATGGVLNPLEFTTTGKPLSCTPVLDAWAAAKLAAAATDRGAMNF